MAHGYLEFFAEGKATVYSAGVETHGVNPQAVYFMKEDGIDIAHHTSNNVLEYKDVEFDFVITVCDHAKEVCPYFPTKAVMLHHNFQDPSKVTGAEQEVAAAFRKVREEIKEYCRKFVAENII